MRRRRSEFFATCSTATLRAIGSKGGTTRARNWERRVLTTTAKCADRETAVLLAYQMGQRAAYRKRAWAKRATSERAA
jgi:hypothetical protein